MIAILVSLLPVILLIGLGYVFRRSGFPGDSFWYQVERLTYFVLFPALLVDSLARADLGPLAVGPMAAAMATATLLVSGLVVAARPLLDLDGPTFTSVFQGAIRFNTYVGIAAAAAIYGSAGLTLSAVAMAVLIPLVNVLSVIVLLRHGSVAAGEGPAGGRLLLSMVVQNPLILACLAGGLLNFAGGLPPLGIGEAIHVLGAAALPLGLLAVGAGLDPAGINATRAPLLVSAVARLVVMPLAMLFGCYLFGVSGLTATIAVLFGALPGASTAYILARQLGGDAGLMANIITVTTLAAIVTMPAILAFVD